MIRNVGIVLISLALSLGQATTRPTVQAKPADRQTRNLWIVYYDEALMIVGRHYGDGRDPSNIPAPEPGLFVHCKAADKWIQITAISTAGGKFGYSGDLLVSVGWDFRPFASRPYIEQPLRTSGSLMFPDKVQFDAKTGLYELRHSSRNNAPDSETVLYVSRAELLGACAK